MTIYTAFTLGIVLGSATCFLCTVALVYLVETLVSSKMGVWLSDLAKQQATRKPEEN